MSGSYGEELLRATLAGTDPDSSPITHSEVIPAAVAEHADWPSWLDPAIVAAYGELGLHRPWRHQIEAADHAFAGRHVVISTGTASGKSLAYQLPVLQTLLHDHASTALYLAPTKALGVDQLRSLSAILATNPEFTRLAPCTYDGDTDAQLRQWARANSRMLFTNPDMLHIGILSGHHRWQQFLRQLKFIVVDECHHYRGVFGAHTALVLRRLLRVARAAGADPVVVAASATTAEPARTLGRLIGEDAVEVTHDSSPTGERTVALWEPDFLPEVTGENGAPVRRSAGAEAGRILADFVIEGARTLCFVRSRRGAEITARTAAGLLESSAPDLAGRVAAYRAGYLADDRRKLERAIADGELLGVATTNALELGVDISGLDAVVIAGYPGTVASFWQQAGRAGRRGAASAVVLVARDDPLDTYLVHHPDALLRKPVETTVFDPMNPYVLKPHLLCAAAELPLKPEEVERLGVAEAVDELTAEGLLRRRKAGWYIAAGVEPHADIDIRGGIGGQILIVDTTTSQLLGTVDTVRALSTVHPGAVHIHQGRSFVVDDLDLADGLALVHPEEPDWTTSPRETTEVEVLATEQAIDRGALRVALVEVEVTSQVVGYLRKLHSGEILDSVELDLPPQTLPTRAVQYTLTPEALAGVGITDVNLPGALHAAEHAMIGMLPLVATCDRWDIGGLSTNIHADTGLPTVYVYDGYPGGAGFADRGYEAFAEWVAATHEAVASCGCEKGCPSCVQSPKCGNGNEPLDKAGAIAVLDLISRLLR
ncbi:MAG: DEAD/DEAH box helicase [Gordonia sp. (in: high G+C Gram-positive bacteria)]|uniref:DEAD/DEAH box helicase n=1 Tax=Gordonia sp. (in: high G+C Gram-positive bacteria) TaxID=84139 RepID=UPI0039E6890D